MSIRVSIDAGVASLSLAAAGELNALSNALLDSLIEAVATTAADSGVTCIVIRSDHDSVFSAGGDLDRFRGSIDVVAEYNAVERYPRLFRQMWGCGKPILAVVNGLTLGGAVGLVLASDLVLAAEESEFGIPELDIGLFPYFTAALLHRNVPLKMANELIMLGGRISAGQAREIGLVNQVVPRAQLAKVADDWARRLAARPATAMSLGKSAMYAQLHLRLDDAVEYMRQALAIGLASDDLREGIGAFDARRAARRAKGTP